MTLYQFKDLIGTTPLIKIENKILMTNTKQKDFELFDKRAFQLTQVPLFDEEGKEFVDDYDEPITSCVLKETEVTVEEKKTPNLGSQSLTAGSYRPRPYSIGYRL